MFFLELTGFNHNETIHINNPTCGTQLFKPLVTHIQTYMVVMTIPDINIILLEEDEEITIIAKICGDKCVRLTLSRSNQSSCEGPRKRISCCYLLRHTVKFRDWQSD
jgi:hypothetical protein